MKSIYKQANRYAAMPDNYKKYTNAFHYIYDWVSFSGRFCFCVCNTLFFNQFYILKVCKKNDRLKGTVFRLFSAM